MIISKLKKTIKRIIGLHALDDQYGSDACSSPSTSKLHELISAGKWRQATKQARLSPNDAKWISEGGYTELHHALLLNAPLHLIDALMRVYPSAIGIQDEIFGVTPLHVAAEISSADVIKILVLYSKEEIKRLVHTVPEYGLTRVTNIATSNRHRKGPSRRDQVKPSDSNGCELLHASLMKQDKRGLTALHRAIKKKRPLDVIGVFTEACPGAIKLKSADALFPEQEVYNIDAPEEIKEVLR